MPTKDYNFRQVQSGLSEGSILLVDVREEHEHRWSQIRCTSKLFQLMRTKMSFDWCNILKILNFTRASLWTFYVHSLEQSASTYICLLLVPPVFEAGKSAFLGRCTSRLTLCPRLSASTPTTSSRVSASRSLTRTSRLWPTVSRACAGPRQPRPSGQSGTPRSRCTGDPCKTGKSKEGLWRGMKAHTYKFTMTGCTYMTGRIIQTLRH